VRKSFDESFAKISDHTLWFDKYSQIIDEWAQNNQEPMISEPSSTTTQATSTSEQEKTTVHSVTTTPSSTNTTKPSSATSNVQNSLTILQFTAITLLVKTYIL
jgi:hypothetical protein